MLTHLHFGPGRFGLGFVLPTLQDALAERGNWRTVVVARSKRDYTEALRTSSSRFSEAEYRVCHPESQRIATIDALIYFDDSQALMEIAADEGTALVTTSVGTISELDRVASVLAQAAEFRMGRATDTATQSALMAFENAPRRTRLLMWLISEHLDVGNGELSRIYQAYDIVADCICPLPAEVIRGEVAIRTESHRQWYCARDARSAPEAPWLEGFEFVEPRRFSFLEQRKLWLVNAMQTLAALRVRRQRENDVRAAFDDPGSREFMDSSGRLLQRAVMKWAQRQRIETPEATLAAVRAFGEEARNRISSLEGDTVDRILGVDSLSTCSMRWAQAIGAVSGIASALDEIEACPRDDLASEDVELLSAIRDELQQMPCKPPVRRPLGQQETPA